MFTKLNYRIFISVIWLFWSTIFAYGLVVWGHAVKISIFDSLISNAGLVIASLVLTFPMKYYPIRKQPGQLLLWLLIVVSIWQIATLKILHVLPQSTADYVESLDKSTVLRFLVGFFALFLNVLLRWFWQIAEEQRKMEERQQQTEQLARKTELKTLREQLHPHFLFNTLNSVSALIEVEPVKARKMVLQLSDFLRGTVNKHDKQPVKLGDEITQMKLYLEIEKVRFGHRLDVEFQIDEDCIDQIIPTFVLQPLVENAVKFGLYDTTEKVCIKFTASVKDNYVLINISNPFDSKTSANISGTGFGQKSVQRRLFLLYGRTDLFATSTEENTYTISLKFPLQ